MARPSTARATDQGADAWEADGPSRPRALVVTVAVLAAVVLVGLLGRPPAEPEEGLTVSEAEAPPPTATETAPPVTEGLAPGEWAPMAAAPFRPDGVSPGVWSEERLLVWDGAGSGAMYLYDPAHDTWRQGALAPRRSAGRSRMLAVPGGVVVVAGTDEAGQATDQVMFYRVSVDGGGDRWALGPPLPLSPRADVGAAYDPLSESLIVWGGDSVGAPGPRLLADGVRLDLRGLADGARLDQRDWDWQTLPDLGLAPRADASVMVLDSGEIVVIGGTAGLETLLDGALLRGDGRVVPIPPPPVAYDQPPTYATDGGGVVVWGRPADFADAPGHWWAPFEGWRRLPRLLNQERAVAEAIVRRGFPHLLVVWGGLERRGPERVTDGFWLDLFRQTWRVFPAAPLAARSDAVVVLAGEDLLVWGGRSGGIFPNDGAVLRLPPPDG